MKLADFDKCCGCGNCALVCGKGAIKIKLDDEGFLKAFVSERLCIDCHSCEKSCPIINDMSEWTLSFGKNSYYGNVKDKRLLGKVSSGGIATALAIEEINNNSGIVYGSAYANDYRSVLTTRVETYDEMVRIMGSKYVQSEKKDAFKKIKCDLRAGKSVLYIGLPCEVAALKMFLKGDPLNLLTCDLVCHGPTSLFVLWDYEEYVCKGKTDSIKTVNMRYKKRGKWSPYFLRIESMLGAKSMKPFWESEFGFAFSRFGSQACYSCQFKSNYRFSDITLGDAWGADKCILEAYEGGLSSVIVNSSKGKQVIDRLVENSAISLIPVDLEKIIAGNLNIIKPRMKEIDRDRFSVYLKKYGLIRTVRKFRPFKTRVIILLRNMIEKK